MVLNEKILLLKEVAICLYTYGRPSLSRSRFLCEEREQWGAAAKVIRNTTSGLLDHQLRKILEAESIREMLSKVEKYTFKHIEIIISLCGGNRIWFYDVDFGNVSVIKEYRNLLQIHRHRR
jgi:hypothetical protein